MKGYSLLLSLAVLAFSISSCQETTDPVETSTMLISKKKITLNSAMHMDSSFVALSCGCRFTLNVEKFLGDTNAIHYTQRDASNGSHRVALDITGDTLAATGTYTARIAVLNFGSKGTFRDTIDVSYDRN
jgi:hypothetical protein